MNRRKFLAAAAAAPVVAQLPSAGASSSVRFVVGRPGELAEVALAPWDEAFRRLSERLFYGMLMYGGVYYDMNTLEVWALDRDGARIPITVGA